MVVTPACRAKAGLSYNQAHGKGLYDLLTTSVLARNEP